MGHSPQGRRESDTTEHTLLFFFSLAVNNPAWTLVLMVLDVSFLGFFLCCSHVRWYPPILYSSFDSPRCVVGWRPFERWLFFSLLFSGSPFSAHFREMLCYDQQSRSFWHCFSLAGWGRGELGANHYLWKVWVRWGKKKGDSDLFTLFWVVLLWQKVKKVLAAQSCPTLCGPMDCSLPGSSVQGILQARILWWVAMPSSRGSSQPRD